MKQKTLRFTHYIEDETSILKRASFAGFAVVVRKLFAGMSLWY